MQTVSEGDRERERGERERGGGKDGELGGVGGDEMTEERLGERRQRRKREKLRA